MSVDRPAATPSRLLLAGTNMEYLLNESYSASEANYVQSLNEEAIEVSDEPQDDDDDLNNNNDNNDDDDDEDDIVEHGRDLPSLEAIAARASSDPFVLSCPTAPQSTSTPQATGRRRSDSDEEDPNCQVTSTSPTQARRSAGKRSRTDISKNDLVTQLIRNSKGNQEAKVRVAEEHTKRVELRLAFKQSKWEQELVARKGETEARKEELQRFQEVLREERRRYEEARNEDLKRLQEARREDREMLMGLMQQMNASKEHNT